MSDDAAFEMAEHLSGSLVEPCDPEGIAQFLEQLRRTPDDDQDDFTSGVNNGLEQAAAIVRRLGHPPLFQKKTFTGASGRLLHWKIECDALTRHDWECLAFLAAKILPPFGKVEGVPTGGWAFSTALQKYATGWVDTLLIADDVYTTGGSMERHRKERKAIGVVAFARNPVAHGWITPIININA